MSETEYAFPHKKIEDVFEAEVELFLPGMTLRDYFAGQALTGMLLAGPTSFAPVVEGAYKIADAMLKAREEVSDEES